MRKILVALAVIFPLIISCSDTIVNPETANQTNTDQINNTDQTDSTAQTAQKRSWIKLPENPGIIADSEYSASKVIDGDTGGIVELYINYVTKASVNVIINASIEVPAGAYSGKKNIKMIINSNNGTAKFYPSPEMFSKPLIYNLKINGIELNGVDKKKLDYVYLAPDGSFQRIEYKQLVINDGVLIVEDAQIPHFSIYGWCR